MRCDIGNQSLLLGLSHQPIKISGLYEIVVLRVTIGRVVPREPVDLHRRPQWLIALDRATEAVGLVSCAPGCCGAVTPSTARVLSPILNSNSLLVCDACFHSCS